MDDARSIQQAIIEYYAAAQIINQRLKANEQLSDTMVRDLARCSYQVFRAYVSPENWPNWDRKEKSGAPIVPLPVQLADDVARQIYMLANGHIPQWMLHLQKVGSPISDPRTQQEIGLALAYKSICETGRIQNPEPVKTISDAYGVTRRAVQKWAKEYPTDPSLWFPQATSVEERAQMIAAEMPLAGARYRKWGRGTNNARPHGKAARRPRAK